MPESMVLRFRDLAGDTIPEHQALIEEHGYCWWGWWNKPNEKIPREVMAEFQARIQEHGHLDVFLIDSGNVRLWRARIVGIHLTPTNRLEPCPEPQKTPQYYRDRKWKMWFRMDHIEEETDGDRAIRDWSYDEVPELIEDPLGDAYQDKRVHSLQEMLDRRHRTIYFLQPHRPEHRDQALTPALPALPSTPFLTRPILTDSSYLLHLSDLHFGTSPDGRSTHGFGDGTEPQNPSLTQMLTVDLEELFADTPPAAIIVSGDLTWKGAPEEYELAAEFLRDLRSIYDLDSQQILVIPGNHDIAWAETGTEEDYDPAAPVTRPRAAAERNYRNFFRSFYGFGPNEHLSAGRRLVLGNYVPVDLLGLNSCLLEQEHFAGYGFVSTNQLQEAAAKMAWDRQEHGTKYRLVIMHHHLVAVAPKEEVDQIGRMYSLTLDAGEIAYRLLGLGSDLVLHGHLHQPFASTLSRLPHGNAFPAGRSLGIHATGSAGVRRSHTGGIGKNAYSILYPEPDRIRVRVRALSENRVGFEDHWTATWVGDSERGGVRLA